jgi:hypothetical protein
VAHYFPDPLNCIFIKFHCTFLFLLALAKRTSSQLSPWILEVVHQVGSPLDACICKFANLFAVKAIPPPTVEFLVELEYEFGVDEVGKSITHVAWVGVVDGQVQKVYVHAVVFADLLQQHVFRVLVRNVSDHQRCPKVCLDLRFRRFTLSGIMRYSWAY